MATKTSGIEFKRFYNDAKYWPPGADVWHEDVTYVINGKELSDDEDPTKVTDSDVVVIHGGMVMKSPLYKEGNEPSVESYFRRWKKEQTTTAFVVECDVAKIEVIKAAIKAAGGKIAV